MVRADLLFLLTELADAKIHVESVYGGSNRDNSSTPIWVYELVGKQFSEHYVNYPCIF